MLYLSLLLEADTSTLTPKGLRALKPPLSGSRAPLTLTSRNGFMLFKALAAVPAAETVPAAAAPSPALPARAAAPSPAVPAAAVPTLPAPTNPKPAPAAPFAPKPARPLVAPPRPARPFFAAPPATPFPPSPPRVLLEETAATISNNANQHVETDIVLHISITN